MVTSLRSAIASQINTIIARHLEELGQYLALARPDEFKLQTDFPAALEKLDSLCTCPTKLATQEMYVEASNFLERVVTFLKSMNQDLDEAFWITPVGEIVLRASEWCRQVGCPKNLTPLSAVWNWIAPVQPDHLDDLGDGLYEARWWSPVPMMDIEILQRTEGVEVQGTPFEPLELPCGLALRFAIKPTTTTENIS